VPTVATAFTCVMCAFALLAHERERHAAYAVLKVLASAGFVAVALSSGVPHDTWRIALAAGLSVALAGDALLAVRRRWAFPAGMAAFLVVHILYLAGFVVRGVDPVSLAIAFAVMATAAGRVWRRGSERIPERLRPALAVYMSVLVLDMAAGVSAAMLRPGLALAVGILLMGLSDIAVLRDRFIAPGIANKLVGLPMYYAGQLLLAWAVIGAA